MSWPPNSLPNPTKTQLFLKQELPLALSSHPPPLEAISSSWQHQICCWPACIHPDASLGSAFPHLLLLLSDPLHPPAHGCCCLLCPMGAFGSARLQPCSAQGLFSCLNASCSFLLILCHNSTLLGLEAAFLVLPTLEEQNPLGDIKNDGYGPGHPALGGPAGAAVRPDALIRGAFMPSHPVIL